MHFLEMCEDRLRETFDRHLIYISIVSTMATIREDEGRFEESEVLCRRVLQLLMEAFGSHPHLMTARAHFNLGLVQMRKEEYQLAADSFQTALNIFDKSQDHATGKNESLIDFSARVKYSLGQCFHSLGHFNSAQEILESVADLRLSFFGDSDPEFTAALNSLSLVLGQKREFNAALDCAEQCYALREQVCGGRSPSLITIQNNLAVMHLLLSTKHNIVDEENRAEEMLTKSLESRTIITNYASREVEVALLNLANMFLLNDDYDKDMVDPLLHGAAAIRAELDKQAKHTL
jgi:tetratricopeptide (TPR) repeat protein